MIVRKYIQCSICNKHHTLRIQIGMQPTQRHNFSCANCLEPISLALSIHQSEGTCKLTELKGAVIVNDQCHDNTTFHYLATDFAADSENINNPLYFGSMTFMTQALSSPYGQQALSQAVNGDMTHLFDIPSHEPLWSALQRCWRLTNAGKHGIASQSLSEIARDTGYEKTQFRELLRAFLAHQFGVNNDLIMQAQKALKAYPSEFKRMLLEFEINWKPSLKADEYQILTDYFANYAEHGQVRLYLQVGLQLPQDHIVTSNNFQKVRGFYPLAFELHSKQMLLLTAINNILCGRAYDRLENISLHKYSTSDAAKRRNNFEKNHTFKNATLEHSNNLRNAINHNWISLSPDGATIFINKNGRETTEQITYTEYLWSCGLIMRQISQLMILEITLDDISRHFAYVVREPN